MRINVVIKYPLSTKKIVTPTPPGTKFSKPAWAQNTSATATARIPSRDGIGPDDHRAASLPAVMATQRPPRAGRTKAAGLSGKRAPIRGGAKADGAAPNTRGR